MSRKIALVVILMAVVVAPSFGDPSMFGPSGLIRVPGTNVVPEGGIQLSGHFNDDLGETINANIGVIERLEASVSWINPDGGGDELVLSAKYRLWGEEDEGYSLAVGIFDVTDELNDGLFGCVSKLYEIGNTDVRAIAGWGENRTLVDGFFAGAEVMLGDNYDLLLEYDGNDVNGALRFPLSERWRVAAGIASDDLYLSAVYFLR